MNDHITVAHQSPGRVRLTIDGRRGDSAFFHQLAQRCAALTGVNRVRINPTAASLVVEYRGTLQALIRQAAGLFAFDGSIKPGLAADEPLPFALVSGRELNPMFMSGAAFALLGLIQSLRGRVTVPAATAFWYAATNFQQARNVVLVEPDTLGETVKTDP
jgi:hypothetical protein